MQSLSFIKELEEEEVESLCFFFFFLGPNGPLGVGHGKDKREKLRGMFGVLPMVPFWRVSSQGSFLHILQQHIMFRSFKGQMNSSVSRGFP